MSLLRPAAIAVVLAASSAMAWPVDWVHEVEPGKEKFVKLPSLDWVAVDDESVAKAEWFAASGELLLEGVKPGRALVLLGAEGKIAAWRVRVGGKPVVDQKKVSQARVACGEENFKVSPLAPDVKLAVTVKTEACRAALLTLFQTDAFEARHLELTFDAPVLQTQLKALQGALSKVARGAVSARYVGAGLVLESEAAVSRAEYEQVLWAVLTTTVGRFALDEKLDVKK